MKECELKRGGKIPYSVAFCVLRNGWGTEGKVKKGKRGGGGGMIFAPS